MAVIINDRDIALQAVSPRLVATSVAITSTSATFTQLKNGGAITPASILLTPITTVFTSPTYTWEYATLTNPTVFQPLGSSTITSATFNTQRGSDTGVIYKVTANQNGFLPASNTFTINYFAETDEPLIVEIDRPGSNVPSASDGSAPVFTDTNATIRVKRGSTYLTYGISGNNTWSISSSVTTGSITIAAPDTTTDNTKATYPIASAMTTDTAVVTYTINIRNASGVTISPASTITQTFTKIKAAVVTSGTNGRRTAILDVYKWSAVAPTTWPSGTSTYTWSNSTFTAPSILNGWTLTPSAAVLGQSLYICRQVYSDTDTTTTSNVTWSANSAMVLSASGVNGQRVGLLEVYKWSITTPITYPSGTSEYTWANGTFTEPTTTNGWTLTPGAPSPGEKLWGISVVVSDNLTTATSTATWNSSAVYVIGASGIDGSNAALLTLTSTGSGFIASDSAATVVDGPTLTFNAIKQNLSGTANITATAYNAAGDSLGTITMGGTGDTNRTLSAAQFTTYANTKTVRVEASLNSLSDYITVYRGDNGTDSLHARLTNEAHIVPADSTGVVSTYSGASGSMQVYKGTTLLTNASTPSVSYALAPSGNPESLTYSLSSTTGAYSVTGGLTAGTDTATLTIRATLSTGQTLDSTFTLNKSKAGQSGTAYWITTTSGAISKANDGTTFTPSSITVNAYSQSGTDAVVAYSGRFRIASSTDGSTYGADVYASATAESTKTQSITGSTIKLWRFRLYDSTDTTLLDELILPVIPEGFDGITVLMPNSAHTLPADKDGLVTSYAGSGSTMKVLQGTTELTRVSTITGGGQYTIGTAVQNPLASVSSVGTWSGTTEATLTNHSGMSNSVDVVTLTWPLTVRTRDNLGSISTSAVQTLTKSKQGATGAAAQYVRVTGEQSFKFLANSSTPTVSSITLGAELFGGLTLYDWEYWNGSAWTNLSGTQNTQTYSLAYNNAAWSSNTLRVRCVSGGFNDELTIVKLYDGANATVGYLTNEATVVATAADGSGAVYTTAGGTFRVYRGISEVTASSTFSITGGTDGGTTWTKVQNGLTMTINETTGVYSLSGTSWSSETESFTLVGTYDGVSISKVYTITKSKQGTAGANAQSYWLVVSAGSIQKNIAGTHTPASLVLTGKSQIGTNAPADYTGRFTVEVSTDGTTYGTPTTTGDVSTYTYSISGSPKLIRTRMYQVGGTTVLLDEQIIPVVSDGTEGITVIASNQSHTLPASDTSGNVTNFTGSGTTIQVYEGSTLLQYNTVLANGRFTIGTPTVNPTSAVTVGTPISGSGTTTATVPNLTAMATNQSVATITFPLTIQRANGTQVSASMIQTITKAASGIEGITVIASNRAHTLPASDTSGNVTNFTGSGTTIQVYEGSTLLQYNTVLANGRFTIGTPTVAPTSAVTVGTPISGSGTTTATVPNLTAMAAAQTAATVTFPLTIQRSNGSQVTASVVQTITKAAFGATGATGISGLTIINSRPAATLNAANDGTVSVYTNTGTTFQVLEGSDILTYNSGTLANSQFNFTTSISPAAGVTLGAISGSGTTTATVANITAMAQAQDAVSVTYTFSIRRASGITVTMTSTQNFTKSKTGPQGGTGNTGAQGNSARIAYALYAGGTASPITGSDVVISGDGLTTGLPATTSWTTTAASSFTVTPQTPASNQQLMVTDGIYNPVTANVTWKPPYLAYFKVGALSAITTETGTLSVGTSGYVRSGSKGYADGTAGFFLGYDSTAYKFDVGSSTAYLRWTGSAVQVKGAITADSGDIAGSVTVGASGNLRSGKTGFSDNTNAGFILGNDGTTPKFFIGNAGNSKSMLWDGSDLTFRIGAASGVKFYDVTYSRNMGSIEGINFGTGNCITLASPILSGSTTVGGAGLASTNGSGQAYAQLLANALGSNAVTFTVNSPAANGTVNILSGNAADMYIGASTSLTSTNVVIQTGSVSTKTIKLSVSSDAGTLILGNASVSTNVQIVSTLAAGTAPLNVTSGTVCTNLNADMLDGLHIAANTNWWNRVPTIGSDGVMEGPRYIDFHAASADNNSTIDYGARIELVNGTSTGQGYLRLLQNDGTTANTTLTILAGIDAGTPTGSNLTGTAVPSGRGTVLKWLRANLNGSSIWIPYVT